MEITDEILNKTSQRRKAAQANASLIMAVSATTDMVSAEKEASRLMECCDFWQWDAYYKNKVLDLRKVNRCRSRYCPNCRAINTAKIIHQIIPLIDDLQRQKRGIYHMTLTIPNVPPGELDSTCERMTKSFKKWWNWVSNDGKKKYAGRKYKAIGAIKSLEITYNAQTRTWHPHYHVLIVSEKELPDDYLKQNVQTAWDINRGKWTLHSRAEIDTGKLWASAYNGRPPGDAIETYECKIQEICNLRGIIEVLKYPAKESDFARMDLTEFTEFYRAMKFRRTRQAYGIFYNVRLDDTEKNEDVLEVDLLKSILHIPEEPKILITAYDTLIQDYHSWRKISRYRAHEGFNMGAEDAENVSNNAENVSKQTKTDTFSAQNVSKSAENISKSQHIINIKLSVNLSQS